CAGLPDVRERLGHDRRPSAAGFVPAHHRPGAGPRRAAPVLRAALLRATGRSWRPLLADRGPGPPGRAGEGPGGAPLNAVTTEGLTKQYGSLSAVDHLDLSVERGALYGFLGPNGAGKTTTIRMMLGLIFPTAGEVTI